MAGQTGSIGGTVTAASSGSALNGISVNVYDSQNVFVAGASTNAQGQYTVAVAPGTYYLRTHNNSGYIDKLYSNISCGNGCTTTLGTPVTVTSGNLTSGINFSLAVGGSVSGTVTSSSGAALANVLVEFHRADGAWVDSVTTDSSGNYTLNGGLETGSYYAWTLNNLGYINQVHPNASCTISCSSSSGGSLIDVTAGQTTTGINFSLPQGARITGSIASSSGSPLRELSVNFYNTAGQHLAGAGGSYYIDSQGQFTFSVPAGTYILGTGNSLGYINRIHGGPSCGFGCNEAQIATGTHVTVTAGATASGINFSLSPGAQITGTVTNSSGTPLAGVDLALMTSTGQHVATATTDSLGRFRTREGAATGTFYARTNNRLGFVNQLYQNVSCTVNCPTPTQGTGISLTEGQTTGNINFALALGATITGTLTNAATTAAITRDAWVDVYDSNGSFVGTAYGPDGQGTFTASVPAGSYYFRTNNNAGYVNQVYKSGGNISCGVSGCPPATIRTGTAITVAVGESAAGVDFPLQSGGRISGRVTAASGGGAIAGVTVSVYGADGSFITSAPTDANGDYLTRSGLGSGTFYLQTSNSAGYLNQVYQNRVCSPNCPSVTSGSGVSVTLGQTTSGINFSLARAAIISGTITNSATSAVVTGNAWVDVYDAFGAFLGNAGVNAQGQYSASLTPGTYLIRTNNSQGLINVVHSGRSCGLGCPDVTTGTPVTVAAGATATVNFGLAPGARISGRVTSATNVPLAGVEVQLVTASNGYVTAAVTDAQGNYLTSSGVAAGTFYAKTLNRLGYVNQLYQNISCPAVCNNVTAGTALNLVAGQTQANINFSLAVGASISGRLTTPSGAPITRGAWVNAHDSNGNGLGTALGPDSQGNFVISVMPGTYYMVTDNDSGYINQTFKTGGNVSCGVTGCPSATIRTGTPIVLAAGQSAAGVDFTLADGGRVAGTVTAATGGAPIAGLNVNIYSSTGTYITYATTNAQGQYQSRSGLGTGTFYAGITFNTAGYVNQIYQNVSCTPFCPSVTSGTGISVTQGQTRSGIDFALVTGGTITGTVLNSSGAAIAGGGVNVYSSNGAFFTSVSTNAQGQFSFTGLAPGTYYVRTAVQDHINQQWDNLSCGFGCPSIVAGTPIAVTSGQTTSGINFRLTQGGRISGVVRGAGGTPLVNVSVSIFTAANAFVASGVTNAQGQYTTFEGLQTGTYYARVSATSLGYPAKLYDNISCVTCNPNMGTPIQVTEGQTRSDINFNLDQFGTVSGTVTSNGAPAAGVQISVRHFQSGFTTTFASVAVTDSAGRYTVPASALGPGPFYVYTSNSSGLINEIYNNFQCIGPCGNHVVTNNATPGTALTLSAGQSLTNINFDLAPGGRISGRVTDTSATPAPLSGQTVNIVNSGGIFMASALTASNGDYITNDGLLPGRYFAQTSNVLGYVNEVYNDIPCAPTCLPLAGGEITVTGTATTPNINFALSQGGRISGTITSSAGSPLQGISVQVYGLGTGSIPLSSTTTSAQGAYTIAGLAPGTYFVRTSNSQGYLSEAYDDRPCAAGFCDFSGAQGVAVTAGNTTSGIDFVLQPGGRISGTVTDAVTGRPIGGASIQILHANGSTITFATTNPLGVYTTSEGLPTGEYYVRVTSALGYVSELYDDVVCMGSVALSSTTAACTLANQPTVSVTTGATTGNINFALTPGARVSGTITADGSGAPLGGVAVQIYDALGRFIAGTNANSQGQYSIGGLAAGTYYARTFNFIGAVDERFDNQPCVACVLAEGTAITVTAGGTATANFALAAGARVTGTITGENGLPVSNVTVRLFNAAGTVVASAISNGLGQYTTGAGLPPGGYYVTTLNGQGYIDQLYSVNASGAQANQVCLACTPTTGSPLALTAGQTASNVNFALERGGRISGRVTTGSSNVSGVTVRIYNRAGVQVTSGTTSSVGYFVTGGLPTGTYYAQTFNTLGYVDKRYNDAAPCPGCAVTDGAPISVTAGATTSDINFDLAIGGRIAGTITGSDNTALANVTVSVYDAENRLVTAAVTNSQGQYITGAALATGVYFVRTSNSLGFLDELYDNVSCASCTPNTGTPVSVTAGSTTSNINFQLASGGRVTGRITASAGGAGLANVTVAFYDANGTFVGSTVSGPTGDYISGVLPAGGYFARTSNTAGYIDELYDDIACLGFCLPQTGRRITVAGGQTVASINFALVAGGGISGTITSGTTPLSGVAVNIVNATGTLVTTATSNAAGQYATTVGLLPGIYYARTATSLGYINEVYDNIPCIGTLSTSCVATRGTPITVAAGAVTSGRNFDLAAGGAIAGTITDAATNAPLQNITVAVYNSSGGFVTTATTNSAGQYVTSSGLLPGRYHVATSNTLGYVNEVYDNIRCGGYCTPLAGAAISVTAGVVTPAINFALDAGGRVSGTVRGAGGNGLAFVIVDVFTLGGTRVASGITDTTGGYITQGGLPAGRYYAATYNNLGLLDSRSAEFAVTPPSTTTGVNFTLGAGGRISGTITATGGTPLPGVTVQIYNGLGFIVSSIVSGADGRYVTSQGLPVGTYYARTSNTLGYIDERYDNTVCVNCSPLGGRAITVTAGTTTMGVDFSLDSGGGLSGRVTDAAGGTALGGVTVAVFASDGRQVATGVSDDSGRFVVAGLPTGTYFAQTRGAGGYIDEIYNDIACSYAAICPITSGTPVTVSSGTIATGIDFALTGGGRIAGSVVDTATPPAPISSARVSIFDSLGRHVVTVGTDDAGRYVTTTGLPPGTYFAQATADAYTRELYSEANCFPSCVVTSGRAIAVTAGATAAGVNFTLAPGGRISGRVTEDGSAATPLPNVTIGVYAIDGRTLVTSAVTDGSGQYVTQSGLAAGSYRLRTFNTAGYINEAYDNVVCPGALQLCADAAVVVTASAPTPVANFALARAARISGRITDAASGLPLPNVTVMFFGSNGLLLNSAARTDSDGRYESASGLADGTYYVATRNTLDYVDEAFNNVVCPQARCDVRRTTGVTIASGAGGSNVDFALASGGRISGRVTGRPQGASSARPLPNVRVDVYGATGIFLATAHTDGAGVYTLGGGLAAGGYYVKTSNALGYVDELYDNLICVSCIVTGGRAISVSAGATTPNIDFELTQGGLLSGTVFGRTTGQTLADVPVVVKARTTDGTTRIVARARTDTNGVYAISLPPGLYYVQTDAIDGFATSIYRRPTVSDGGTPSCPRGLCDPDLGSEIDVVFGAQIGQIDLGLAQCTPITVSPSSLSLGSSGARYAQTITASGGTAPYGFALTDGELPPGLTLNPDTGAITGATTAAGATTFTIAATDSNGCSGSVTYNPSFCSIDLSSSAASVSTAAGSGSFTIAASATDCPWTASSDASWLTVSGTSGTGNASVTYSYADRGAFAQPRTATITVGGRTFTVTQSGIGATYVISPMASVVGPAAGSYSLQLVANTPDAPWTVTSDSAWLVPIATSGTGSATLGITTARNATQSPRTGTLVIAGQTISITQRANGIPGAPEDLTARVTAGRGRFAWVPPPAGGDATSYVLEAGLVPGTTAASFATADATPALEIPPTLPSGRFYFRVRARNEFGTGAPSEEYELSVGPDGTNAPGPPLNVIATMSGSRLSVTWDAPATGGMPTGYVLEAGSASGARDIATLPVAGRAFTYDGVPAGFYFLRVRGVNGSFTGDASTEVLLRVGNVPSPPDAPRSLVASAAGSTVALAWGAPSAGPAVTSYVLEAGTARGRSDIAVFDTGSTATSISFANVPSGVYFVRLRAKNAQGASIVSNEVRLVVP